MYSLNAPVPGSVKRVIGELRPSLLRFERLRERPSLLVKRLGDENASAITRQAARALSGAPSVEARIDGIDYFPDPPAGPGPVLYLAVESPGLTRIHDQLCESFDPVPELEGDGYVPHVTLARGGTRDEISRLVERDVDPVTWTVSELHLRDAIHEEPVHRFSLPA